MSASLAFTWSGPGLELPLVTSRCKEFTVAVLPPWSARLCPYLLPAALERVSQARPAALEAAGGPSLRPPEALGDFDGRFPSFPGLKVVSIRPFLSGLGVRDVICDGTGTIGGERGMLCPGSLAYGAL